MKIYLSGSIRGGREFQRQYFKIAKILEKYGTVMTIHIANDTLSKYGETEMTDKEIHDRELARIQSCDILIAEASTTSTGVGYVIGQAVCNNKRVICLYYGDNTYKLSAMVKGNTQIEKATYKTIRDLNRIFSEKLTKSI